MRRILIPVLLLVVPAAACGDDDAPLPDPDELLQRSASAMAAVESAEFEMSVSGAAVTVSGLALRHATGVYMAPDRARAVLGMRLGEIALEMVTISIAERTWITEPLTGRWNELDPGTGFNPAILFGDDGWQRLLGSDLVDATVARRDAGYLVEGTAPAERVAVLTSGLVRDQDVAISLIVDRDSALLREVRFSTIGGDGTTDWLIRLGPYGVDADVEAPV